ncbi:MAG: response regulator [Methanobacteriota archaeon]|jgi:DNA-binding NtrC family response regulator|nr:MAG: response regulator [Euryarchaeota archaeon]TMA01256.1 MAG: response regulator [Euryarchaeota archaeon]
MMILAPEKTTIAGGRILIVDDDDGVRENLAELFQVVGYSVVTAGSAPEAMGKLAHHDVDLLLTDYRMPGPNGVELIESARRVKPGLRAILMTAFGDSFTEIESVRRGAIGYVNKPFEADEITNLVSRILGLRGD